MTFICSAASNPGMLSKDIAADFRGRGSVTGMHPLSFSELCSFSSKEKADVWEEYIVYGGMRGPASGRPEKHT